MYTQPKCDPWTPQNRFQYQLGLSSEFQRSAWLTGSFPGTGSIGCLDLALWIEVSWDPKTCLMAVKGIMVFFTKHHRMTLESNLDTLMLGYIKGTAVIQTEKCWILGRKGDGVELWKQNPLRAQEGETLWRWTLEISMGLTWKATLANQGEITND